MAKVIRLFGKADSFDIEFSRKGDKWEVDIPPDMTDGVYAAQLTAVDELGETAYWVGELYMCSGVCHLKIDRAKMRCIFSVESYRMEASPLHRMGFSVQEYSCRFSKNLGIRFRAEERKRYRVLFSASDGVLFSKGVNMDFTAKKLQINSYEKKMLMRCTTVLSIRKECGHV